MIGLILFALIVMVGDMDYTNDVAEFKRYCLDVKEGVYPDYKQIIDKCE